MEGIEGKVEPLTSTLPIKQWWLFNEWAPECRYSKGIVPFFPARHTLHPTYKDPDTKKIETVFEQVRGKYLLWKERRENASWEKITTPHLSLSWILENVIILYSRKDRFEVTELNGIVLWKEPKAKKYHLLEGNHRISAWINSNHPPTLPAILFIGIPKEETTLLPL